VESEVLQAQRQNKIIIPCFHSSAGNEEIKWDLRQLQGIEFNNEYDLVRNLGSFSKELSEGKDDPKLKDISKLKTDTIEPAPAATSIESNTKAPKSSNNIPKPNKSIVPPSDTPFSDSRQHKDGYGHDSSYSSSTISTRPSLKNKPKILLPILIIAVIGSILAFALISGLFTPQNKTQLPNTTQQNNQQQEEQYLFVTKWGSKGSGDGQFGNPSGISIDSSDNVYVADSGNNRIQKFDSNGKFITKWGSTGSGDGQFSTLADIAVDSSGNVYVTDSGNNRIQVFARS
jgi:hypothetical protein